MNGELHEIMTGDIFHMVKKINTGHYSTENGTFARRKSVIFKKSAQSTCLKMTPVE